MVPLGVSFGHTLLWLLVLLGAEKDHRCALVAGQDAGGLCLVPHSPPFFSHGVPFSDILMNDVRNGVPESTVSFSVRPMLEKSALLATVEATRLDPDEVGGLCLCVADLSNMSKSSTALLCADPPLEYKFRFAVNFTLRLADRTGLHMLSAVVVGKWTNYLLVADAAYVNMSALGSLDRADGQPVASGALRRDHQSQLVLRPPDAGESVDILIFTKDRPYRLESLLRSLYRRGVLGAAQSFDAVYVLYRASSPSSSIGYALLRREFPAVVFVRDDEGGGGGAFRERVLRLVESTLRSTHVVPMVDELVWLRDIDFRGAARTLERTSPRGSMQLRLGENLDVFRVLNESFPSRFIVRDNPAEDYLLYDSALTCLSFCDPQGSVWQNDFWFVTSLDAALVRRTLIAEHWRKCSFGHPGELEGAWYTLKSTMAPHTLMPRRSYVVNVEEAQPVRSDRHMGLAADEAIEESNMAFLRGRRMRTESLDAYSPTSPHTTLEVPSVDAAAFGGAANGAAHLIPESRTGEGRHCGAVEIAGLQSSGSTLIFNLVRAIFESSNRGPIPVTKTHRVSADADLRCVLITYRDPRDVLCSAARRQGACFECTKAELQPRILEQLEQIFLDKSSNLATAWDGQWSAKFDEYLSYARLTMLRYEDFVQDVPALVEALSRHFGVTSTIPAATIAANWSLPSVRRRLATSLQQQCSQQGKGECGFEDVHKETHLHGNHISNDGAVGGWRSCLEEGTLGVVRAHLGHVMAALGYRDDE